MNQELTIKIVVENPPGGVDFGLQKGSGSKYETIQIQRSGDKNLQFEFPITVMLNKDGLPNIGKTWMPSHGVYGASNERLCINRRSRNDGSERRVSPLTFCC